MFRFMGRAFRWGLTGLLVTVGLVAVVGLARVKTAYYSVRDHLRTNMDDLVDSRVALRHELGKLQKEYPERIADLRVELARADRDLAACLDDRRICEEVVLLAENDLDVLQQRISHAGNGDLGFVSIEFRSERLGPDEATRRAARIASTATSYRRRLGDLEGEADLLREERASLQNQLTEIQSEYRTFQAEASSLLREIDALQRKEKMVEIAERRAGRGDEDPFSDRSASLARVKEKIEARRIRLDEKLRAIRGFKSGDAYEAEARMKVHRTAAE